MPTTSRPAPRGFTLVELLVVIAIVGLISAVALPVVLPALSERKVGEGARLLHAMLSGARDTAVRAGAPRGIRLLVDPIFDGRGDNPLASNRMIAIEPGPDYSEGRVRDPSSYSYSTSDPANLLSSIIDFVPGYTATHLRVATADKTGASYNPPTGWSYNIRQGDKIRFNDSGNYYTIAGPVSLQTSTAKLAAINPERFVICNFDPNNPLAIDYSKWTPEYLNLTNGIDDDGDGWVDESCDGIDNDGDGIIDPGYDGIDNDGKNGVDDPAEMFWHIDKTTGTGGYNTTINEHETEVFVGTQANSPPKNDTYTIYRRPVVTPGAREVSLPDGIVIDLTTWNAPLTNTGTGGLPLLPERSRVPIDPFTKYVDILIAPSGRVVLPGVGGAGGFAQSPIANMPFYHFWLTDREGVVAPLWGLETASTNPNNPTPDLPPKKDATKNYLLPMPQGTTGYTSTVFLTGNRRLVTLFARTGQLMTNTIETFNATDTNAPYYAAQTGIKEAQ